MPHMPPVLRQALKYAALAGVVLVTAAVIWTLGPGAGWVLRHVDGVHGLKGKELEDALDAIRGRALAVATGLAALVAVYYTARNADTARRTLQHSVEAASRTAGLTEQGQVTERYTKAIEQLGSDKIDIRIGGAYALERIATDSTRDHPTVMEVLAAFVREHTRAVPPDTGEGAAPAPAQLGTPDADLQAALTVIGRRNTGSDTRQIDLSDADLSGANLHDANLRDANLVRANLTGADLAGANLRGANLTRANLTRAQLPGAFLTDADLSGANLTHAILTDPEIDFGKVALMADTSKTDLSGAYLTGADLTHAHLFCARLVDAYLVHADLTDADLSEADLTDANLTQAHLSDTYLVGADLTGANLTHAHLTGANLYGANLYAAKLIGADLSEALLNNTNVTGVISTDDTEWPEGYSLPVNNV